MERLAAALKVVVLSVVFCVSLLVAAGIVVYLLGTWTDCPACWPPSFAYTNFPLGVAALVMDFTVMVLVANSLNRLSKPRVAAD